MTGAGTTADAAGTWQLGDRIVNRVGLGAMRLSQTGSAFSIDAVPANRDRSIATLRRAVELGINHIDTAAFYFSSRRSANELINAALAPYPSDLVIATKVGPCRDASGVWGPAARPEDLRGQVEENLRQLGRDHLDLVYFRRQTETPLGEHFAALAELSTAGMIRHLGLSGVGAVELSEALSIAPVVCVQNRFGIESPRSDDAFIAECSSRGVAFVPFFSLAGDARQRGMERVPDQVEVLARARGVSAAQVLLAWSLQQGGHVLVIPGTGNPDHVVENVAAGSLRLTREELEMLDELRS